MPDSLSRICRGTQRNRSCARPRKAQDASQDSSEDPLQLGSILCKVPERKSLQVLRKTSKILLDFPRVCAQDFLKDLLAKSASRISRQHFLAESLGKFASRLVERICTRPLGIHLWEGLYRISTRDLLLGSLGKIYTRDLSTGSLDKISWQDLRAGFRRRSSKIRICVESTLYRISCKRIFAGPAL